MAETYRVRKEFLHEGALLLPDEVVRLSAAHAFPLLRAGVVELFVEQPKPRKKKE